MTAGFKFSNLPDKVQQKALNSLNALDLFHFSLLSSRTKTKTKTQQRCFEDCYCAFNISYDKQMEVIVENNSSFKEIRCQMQMIRQADTPPNVLNGTTINLKNDVITEDDRMLAFKDLVEHLRDVFVIKDFNLQCSEPFDLRNSFLWKLDNPPNHLFLGKLEGDQVLSAENVKFALETLAIAEVHIGGDVSPDYTCVEPLRPKIVCLDTAHWLKLEAIYQMTTETLELFDSDDSLSNREIRKIINKWNEGRMTSLKTLTVFTNTQKRPRKDRENRMKCILEGIKTFPWDEANRPAKSGDIDLTKAMDFRRSDGTLASLDISTDIGLLFVVWPKRYAR